jgi:Holliday junction resolvase RusA-like endonuclease
MILFKAMIQMTDSGHIVKKNNRPIYGKMIGKSKRLINAERYLVFQLLGLRKEPITSYLLAKFTFYFPINKIYTKQGTVSKHLADISNLYELPQDCLTKAGIIEDDRLIKGHDGSRIEKSPDNNHYLGIVLTYFDFKP